jgi:hypothetical protein
VVDALAAKSLDNDETVLDLPREGYAACASFRVRRDALKIGGSQVLCRDRSGRRRGWAVAKEVGVEMGGGLKD